MGGGTHPRISDRLTVPNKDLHSWVRLDASWLHNPKVRRSGLFGRALWLAGVLYAYRQNTDGQVSADVLDLLATEAGLTMDQAQEASSKLLEVGLWEREPDGWHIHDYETCQETSEERESRRAQDRERQRRRRAKLETSRPVTRDTNVSHGGVIDPEAEAEEEEDLQERCRVETTNDDPSQPTSISRPPNGVVAQPNIDDSFNEFWTSWPKRDGRKVGKPSALAQWRKLKPTDRTTALTAVANYATERGGPGQTNPADAHRWLRDRQFDEWVDPPDQPTAGRDKRALTARLAALNANRQGA